jgi:hypothetical protein
MPYVYFPLGDVMGFEWVVWRALFPLNVVTAVAIWQQAKVQNLPSTRGQVSNPSVFGNFRGCRISTSLGG